MINRLVTLFILFSFSFAAAGESFESSLVHNEDKGHQSIENLDHSLSTIKADDFGCEDEDCHDDGSHCIHHCSGLHTLVEFKLLFKFDSLTEAHSKVSWYYNNHYQEPALNPSIKPPLFS